jgi:hypothetical protein
VQRLGDQDLAGFRTVGIGGVDEVDAEFDGPQQQGPCLAGSAGSPDARSSDPHRAEAQAVHRQVATEHVVLTVRPGPCAKVRCCPWFTSAGLCREAYRV